MLSMPSFTNNFLHNWTFPFPVDTICLILTAKNCFQRISQTIKTAYDVRKCDLVQRKSSNVSHTLAQVIRGKHHISNILLHKSNMFEKTTLRKYYLYFPSALTRVYMILSHIIVLKNIPPLQNFIHIQLIL